MPGPGVDDPGRTSRVIDDVPDSAATGHLVLPLLQRFTFPGRRAQAALQAVMTLRGGSCSRISPDSVEGAPQVAACLTAELLPSVSRLVAGEPQIVLAFDGRRGRPFAAPRAHSSSGGAGTGPMSPSGSVVKISKRTGSAYTSAECR